MFLLHKDSKVIISNYRHAKLFMRMRSIHHIVESLIENNIYHSNTSNSIELFIVFVLTFIVCSIDHRSIRKQFIFVDLCSCVGFYTGLLPALARDLPFSAIYYTSYRKLKEICPSCKRRKLSHRSCSDICSII
jgi:hypothetical protein